MEGPGPPVVYGRKAGRWLQYWFYYAYNPQDRGIVRTGRHEGDWELVQLRLGPGGRPDLATMAQHRWAQGCAYRELRKAGDGPVLYVANGSHALYPRPGRHDRPWPDPNDEADGRGRTLRPRVVRVDEDTPAWMTRRDRFGGSEAGWVPGEASSPRGPRFQESDKWRDPAGFHRAEGIPCDSGPPGRPLQTALTIALAVGLLLLVLRAARRRGYLQSPR